MKASHYGVIKSMNLACCVTDDGRRFILAKETTAALGIKQKAGAPGLVRFFGSVALKPFVGAKLWEPLNNPIQLELPASAHGSRRGVGFDPSVIIEGAKAVLAARRSGSLGSRREEIAAACESLIESLAGVGLDALIDEATGYDRDRTPGDLSDRFQRRMSEMAGKIAALEARDAERDVVELDLVEFAAESIRSAAQRLGKARHAESVRLRISARRADLDERKDKKNGQKSLFDAFRRARSAS